MVYQGKPSTACRTCRQRRIKCDETRPTCGQCAKSRRQCLGYPEHTDLFFQNQTTAVIRRANRINDANAKKAAGLSTTPPASKASSEPPIFHTYNSSDTTPAGSPGYGLSPMSAEILTHTIFVNPTEPIENRALTFFLTAMIVEPVSAGRTVGHLDILPRLYLQSLSTSALAKVTTAVSVAAFGVVGSDTTLVRRRAFLAYGEAVTSLWKALRDETERGRNETLLACVLMVVVESLLANGAAPTEQWSNHVRGASELLRQRGWDVVLKDSVLMRLFTVVRGFIGHTASGALEDEFFDRELPVPPGYIMSPETRLGRLTLRIADLRDRGFATLILPDNTHGAVDALIAECHSMEAALLDWEASLPGNYQYRLVSKGSLLQHSPRSSKANSPTKSNDNSPFSRDPTNPTMELLPSTLHAYADSHLQRLWNSYRIARIFVNVLLHRAAQLLLTDPDRSTTSHARHSPPPGPAPAPALLASTARPRLLSLAIAILSSIPPFILEPLPSVPLPRNGNFSRASEIALAYHCLFPLYIARGVVLLEAAERERIREVMRRIVESYGVRGGVELMELGDGEGEGGGGGGGERPLWGGPWGRDWVESVWEWNFLYGCGAL
ncbi:uncharacterized protein HMPREF1541_01523 [Cyphellophora europaea CBS 101466]|uniref:Zn(2)-C6 fungal-type domain-containing protein n=1 Tax=Cyphellophora europaea (strain CBS 101466) TaxID=1220924 RepID=W2S370_CYPE1|nr:uncharacterized protein HMPREF1541_01523 [Cyphellophora europaea CBS 101466]ETN42369.1 hypothetical protein HMPREF1541_01523 [Cyphellophora europaea CBS 101466]